MNHSESQGSKPQGSKPQGAGLPTAGLPTTGRLAGIDYGTVHVGIAICDPSQTIASPYENYARRGERQDEAYFRKLSEDEALCGWVVGLPIHLSGEESQKSLEARQFARWLHDLTDRPVQLFDERFTTAMAREILSQSALSGKKRKAKLDQIAAQVLLATFIESGRQHAENLPLDDQ